MRIDRVKLISVMAEQEISGTRLARKSNIARATICGIRSGRSCSEETGRKIAQALNVPLDSLRTKGSGRQDGP